MTGSWVLTIFDLAGGDGGALTGWELDICYIPCCTPPVINTVSVIQPNCAQPTGTIVINPMEAKQQSANVAALEYSVDGGTTWQPSNTFPGLAPGSYNAAIHYQGDDPSCIGLYSENPIVLDAPTGCNTASVGDRVWNDASNDGIQDGVETGINGVTVELLNSIDVVIATTTTSGDGNYIFSGLVAGTYKVRVVSSTLPAGATQTYDLDGTGTPHIATFTLTTGQTRNDADFGYNIYDPCASIPILTCGTPVTSNHSGPGAWNLSTCLLPVHRPGESLFFHSSNHRGI